MLPKPQFHIWREALPIQARSRRWGYAAFVFALLSLAGLLQAADSPALNQLDNLLGHRHYHQALHTATMWLNLNDQALRQKHLTRYQLRTIRARALLELSLFSPAIGGYRAAAAVAPNIPDARNSRAMAALISHSAGGIYIHRIHHGRSVTLRRISILPQAARRRAMRALAEDEWTTLHPRIIRALRAASINASLRILPALRSAVDLQSAAASVPEGARRGKPAEPPAQAAVSAVSHHLVVRITGGLGAMRSTVNRIRQLADAKVRFGKMMRPRGLTAAQRDTLRGIMDTCTRVPRAIRKFVRLFPDFPKDVAALKALNGQAHQVESAAGQVR